MRARLTPIGRLSGRRPLRPHQRGFALLITITLLAFLVLLLVSLASLTRVETQVASNSQQLAQARQNALMALNIAMGQLQKTAGPDQRVTGTADLAGNATGARLIDGTDPDTNVGSTKYWDTTPTKVPNGLSAVQAGTRYWTGVWGNLDVAPATPALGDGNIYEKTPRPVLLNWLVSGNEKTTFTPVIPSTVTPTTTVGQILNVSTPANTPVQTVSPALTASVNATDKLTLSGGSSAVLLVGRNTAGTDSQTIDGKLETAMDRYVVAPLVPINAPKGTVPGLDQNASPPIGRYAYWVGDEGVKARVNLTDSNASHTDTSSDAQARYRLMTAPRSGVEAVDTAFGDSAYQARTQSADPSVRIADRVLGLDQMSLLDPDKISADATGTAEVSPRFHSFTTHSQGLLTDVVNGGLKKDLTYYLESSTLSSPLAGTGILPVAYSPTDAYASNADKRVPKWDLLYNFYQLSNRTPVSLSTPVEMHAADSTHMGLTPIIVQTRLMVGVYADPETAVGTTASTSKGGRGQVAVSPMIMLANPYSVPITSSANLLIEFKLEDGMAQSVIPTVFVRANTISTNKAAGNLGLIPIIGRQTDPANSSILGKVSFKIKGPITFMPGEAKTFTMKKSFRKGSLSTDTAAVTVELEEAAPSSTKFIGIYQERAFSADNTPAAFKELFITKKPGKMQLYQRYSGDFRIGNKSCLLRMNLTKEGDTIPLQVLSGIAYNQFNGANQNAGQWATDVVFPDFPTGTDPLEPDGFSQQSVVPVSCFAFSLQLNAENNRGKLSGTHNTTLRTYADFNLRASLFRATKQVFTSAPYNWAWAGTGEIRKQSVDYNSHGPNDSYDIPNSFVDGTVNASLWGPALTEADNDQSVSQVVLFDVPSRTSTSEMPVFSLGHLQHANVTAESVPADNGLAVDKRQSNVAHQPGYAIGNAYSSPFLPRAKSIVPNVNEYYKLDGVATAQIPATRTYYDTSYLLNTALWDSYYFSSIPQGTASQPPANTRLSTITDTDTRRADAARNQVVNGAFNINSTSVDAWAAVLAGMNNLPALSAQDSAATDSAVAFPRSIRQPGKWTNAKSGLSPDSFNGFRKFTPAQIRTLAASIVSEVRQRGPFVSLAQFVNRTLTPASADTAGVGLSGPLQRAIDKAGLNPISDIETKATNEPAMYSAVSLIPNNDMDDDATVNAGADYGAKFGTYSIYHQTGANEIADAADAYKNTTRENHRSAAIPGWLTQADILQAIGPIITPRSDTFRIRTYGDVLDPLDSGAAPIARAWCEAVVQRMPDYIESNSGGATGEDTATIPASLTQSVNQTLGRRFRVISFRWLSSTDI